MTWRGARSDWEPWVWQRYTTQEATHLPRSQGSGKLTQQKRKLSCFYDLKSPKYHHNATTVETFKQNKRKFSYKHILRDWNQPKKSKDHKRSSFIMLYMFHVKCFIFITNCLIFGEKLSRNANTPTSSHPANYNWSFLFYCLKLAAEIGAGSQQ